MPGSSSGDCLPVLLGSGVGVAHLVAKIVVFAAKTLTLLLECLDITVLLSQLVLQLTNLSSTTCLSEPIRFLALGFWVTFIALDLLFKTEGVENHHVGAVKDQGEEESEAAEVHVALGVKFAGLDFHPAGTFKHCRAVGSLVVTYDIKSKLAILVALLSLGQLDLHTVDAIDAINEQYQDEDERNLSGCEYIGGHAGFLGVYLHPVLQFRYEGIFGYEGEKLSLHRVG